MIEKVNKRSLILTYIDANPGYTLTEAAKACGVSRAMVSIVRKELAIQKGVMAGARSPAPSLDSGDVPSAQTFAEIIENVLAGKGIKITPLQQAQIYSALATHPKAQPGTVITALNGLRALEASAQQTNDIGPGVPLTEEGRIHRLSLLLSAVGREVAKKAWRKAYPKKKTAPPPSPETVNILGANLEATDTIPEGTHDTDPMASKGEAPSGEGSIVFPTTSVEKQALSSPPSEGLFGNDGG